MLNYYSLLLFTILFRRLLLYAVLTISDGTLLQHFLKVLLLLVTTYWIILFHMLLDTLQGIKYALMK